MTDNDSAGTAAELERWINERCTHWHSSGDADLTEYGKGAIKSARETRDVVLPVLASLRKQLAEAQKQARMLQAAYDGVGSLLLDVQNDCIAAVQDNAKKDAALREAVNLLKVLDQLGGLGHDKHGWIKKTLAEIIPASQEAPASPAAEVRYGPATRTAPSLFAPASPKDVHIEHTLAASPSPGLRDAVIEECAQAVEKRAYEIGRQECCGFGQGSPPECCGDPNLVISNRDAADAIRALSRPVSEREGPDWNELRGVAPDATGDQSSEAFIREQRDSWER